MRCSLRHTVPQSLKLDNSSVQHISVGLVYWLLPHINTGSIARTLPNVWLEAIPAFALLLYEFQFTKDILCLPCNLYSSLQQVAKVYKRILRFFTLISSLKPNLAKSYLLVMVSLATSQNWKHYHCCTIDNMNWQQNYCQNTVVVDPTTVVHPLTKPNPP
jgi:hypothetical protein